MNTVEVRTKIIGAEPEMPTISLETQNESQTVRELISRTVSGQIQALEDASPIRERDWITTISKQYGLFIVEKPLYPTGVQPET